MRNAVKMLALGGVALVSAGLILTGCKSAPELTQADALKMIQAKYDADAPVPINITVDEKGLGQGVTAKYWERTKLFPNKYWADFTLTADGKKAVKLATGKNMIEWRPQTESDKAFNVIVMTVAANHLKAHDITDVQDEVLPGAATAKGASFVEGANLEGVPDALQNIAHNPGNHLSTKRHADFVLDGAAWKLQAIQ